MLDNNEVNKKDSSFVISPNSVNDILNTPSVSHVLTL
ncbi:hypothetical protein M2372_003366 [Chryseobacterium sp. BIGb0232]|nr:hypothetical protein [Chryseobacterium sp. BIGb0232]ROS11551.1 hypothetical protein EDF65_3972 [Chryseobacterium nakagawai]